MLTRTLRLSCGLAIATALAAGCAGNKTGGAAARPAPRSEFEKVADPPIASDTRFAAGQLAESRGALAAAAEQYRLALRNNPRHVQAMYRLGVVYAEMKKFAEAVDVWKKYAAATGDSAAAYSNLGFCFELAGRAEEAEAAYLKGIRQDARHVACRVNYGLMLVRRGRISEGKLQLQAVLTPAEVHYNVGSVHEALGRPEQAKAEYRHALRLDPALADAQVRLDELEGAAADQSRPAPSGLSKME
jgi:tetratricopeptide (TPR) repeat protein